MLTKALKISRNVRSAFLILILGFSLYVDVVSDLKSDTDQIQDKKPSFSQAYTLPNSYILAKSLAYQNLLANSSQDKKISKLNSTSTTKTDASKDSLSNSDSPSYKTETKKNHSQNKESSSKDFIPMSKKNISQNPDLKTSLKFSSENIQYKFIKEKESQIQEKMISNQNDMKNLAKSKQREGEKWTNFFSLSLSLSLEEEEEVVYALNTSSTPKQKNYLQPPFGNGKLNLKRNFTIGNKNKKGQQRNLESTNQIYIAIIQDKGELDFTQSTLQWNIIGKNCTECSGASFLSTEGNSNYANGIISLQESKS